MGLNAMETPTFSEEMRLACRGALDGDLGQSVHLSARLLGWDFNTLREDQQKLYTSTLTLLGKGDRRLCDVSVKDLARASGLYHLPESYARSEQDRAHAAARKSLGQLCAAGHPLARQVLADKAQGGGSFDFVAQLAAGGEHLEAGHYKAIAGRFSQAFSSENRQRGGPEVVTAMNEALSRGRRPAIDGTLAALADEQVKPYQQGQLYTLLTSHAGNLQTSDLQALAGQKSEQRFETLLAAATQERPVEGSGQILRQALGEKRQLPYGAYQNLLAWSGRKENRGRLGEVADLLLSGPLTDKKLKSEPIDAMSRKAAAGDPSAIEFLRARKELGGDQERIDTALRQAAEHGNLGALAKITGDISSSQGYEDLSLHLASLGKTDRLGSTEVKALGHVLDTQSLRDADYAQAAGLLGKAGAGPDEEASKAAIAALRDKVGRIDDKGDDLAARALAGSAGRLDRETLGRLTDHPGKDSASTLLLAGGKQKPEQRQELFEQYRRHLSDWKPSSREILRVGTAWATDLSAADIQAVAAVRADNQPAAQQTLLAVAEGQKDQKRRDLALNGLLAGGLRPGQANWDRFVEQAVTIGDSDLKARAAAQLPSSPLSDAHLARVNRENNQRLLEAVKNAREGSNMHKLGQFLQTMHYANDPNSPYRKDIDTSKLKAEYEKFVADPKVAAELEAVRQGALESVFGKGGRERAAKEAANYLTGKDFEQRSSLLPAEQRGPALQQELGRLKTLSPEHAARVEADLQGQIQKQSLELLAALPDKDREKGIEQALKAADSEGLTRGMGLARGSSGVASALSQAIDLAQHEKFHELKGPERLKAALAELERVRGLDRGVSSQTLSLLENLEKKGKLGSFTAAAGVASMVISGLPQDTAGKLASAGDLAGLLGQSESLLKGGRALGLVSLSDDALRASSFLKVARIAGPVGGILSSGVDGFRAVNDFSNQDFWGGIGKGTSALGGGAAVAGGIMLATPAAPLGAVLLVGGAVASVGGSLIDWLAGRDDTQDMFYQLGVLKS